jgi:hypothetical protein
MIRYVTTTVGGGASVVVVRDGAGWAIAGLALARG